MSINKFSNFIFDDYKLDMNKLSVELAYSCDDSLKFVEKLTWNREFPNLDNKSLESSLQLLHLILGVSYFKAYLAPNVSIKQYSIDEPQADFLNNLYKNGLGEFLYMNNLDFGTVAKFTSTKPRGENLNQTVQNPNRKVLVPISGGKDSLLTAEILSSAKIDFTPIYISTDSNYPKILDSFPQEPIIVTRQIARELIEANKSGAFNGHVPFSAIIDSILIITAQIYGFTDIVLSHESSANEATTFYKGESINHQYSKTDEFDQQLQNYVNTYVNPGIKIFSLLSNLSELDINRLFVEKGLFAKYSGKWSSCNVANYKLGHNTESLSWCGKCSKCANAFLLLAPFIDKSELLEMFSGKNLLTDADMKNIFRSLLGETETKPFECVAEINELRQAMDILKASADWPEAADYPSSALPRSSQVSTVATLPDGYQRAIDSFTKA